MQPTNPIDAGWTPELRNRLHAIAAEWGWQIVEVNDVDVFTFGKPTIPLQGPIVVRWAGGVPVRVVMDGDIIDDEPSSPAQFVCAMTTAFDIELALECGVRIIDPAAKPGLNRGSHLYPPAFEAHHTLIDLNAGYLSPPPDDD